MTRSTVTVYLPAATLAIVGVVLQVATLANHDVAWLLTLAERLLDGARPDIDFIEFNPPASYLIYVPAVVIARLLGSQSETALVALVATISVLSVITAGAVLWRARLIERWQMPAMAAAALWVLLIFAYSSFAQREHLALITMLPMLAVYASRANALGPNAWCAFVSGIAGGISVCIKPYFGLALLLPLFWVVWQNRHERRKVFGTICAPENVASALVAILYVVAIFVFFPRFIHHTLPMVLAVYVPARESLFHMLTGVRFTAYLLMVAALIPLGAKNVVKPVPMVASLGSVGFLFAMFLQGRIWFDHAYPALALLMIVTAWLMLECVNRARGRSRYLQLFSWLVIGACALPTLATTVASAAAWSSAASGVAGLAESLRPFVPARPKVIAISERNAFVPIARALHGIWVGSTYFQIISGNVDAQLDARVPAGSGRAKLEEYAHYDREILAGDINRERPDVILIDGPQSRRWALSHPEVAAALRGYREVRNINEILVWVPNHRGTAIAPPAQETRSRPR